MFQPNDLMESAPKIRLLNPSDWEAVRRLHGRVASVYRSPAAWHWRYADAHDGTPASTGVLAIAANHQLVAFVGGRYRWAWSNGQRAQVLVVHDRLGPARQAVNADAVEETLLSRCNYELRELSHGTADSAALLRFESGANDGASASSNTHAVDILWRVCSVSPLVEPPGCSCVVRPTDFIEPGWDTQCQSQVGHAVTSLLKDRAYLAWRYVGHPGEGVSSSNPYWRFAFWSAGSSAPLGCVVLRPGESGAAMLVDAIWPQHVQVLRDGMRQVADFLTTRGVRTIRAAVTAANPGLAYLHSLGFTASEALRTEPKRVQIGFNGALPDASWSIALGDSLLY